MSKLKIGGSSDFHGYLPKVEPVDVFCIVGDISPLSFQFNMPKMQEWLMNDFVNWVNAIPADKVVLVAGNHDVWFERASEYKLFDLEKATNFKLKYLKNEPWNYIGSDGESWSFFGTPYCHIFGQWPFMRDSYTLTGHFSAIPDVVDIIISHDPPFGINDVDVINEKLSYHSNDMSHVGNVELAERLKNVDFKLLMCGHIHSGNHTLEDKCVNVSLLNERYSPVYNVFYTELEK